MIGTIDEPRIFGYARRRFLVRHAENATICRIPWQADASYEGVPR